MFFSAGPSDRAV